MKTYLVPLVLAASLLAGCERRSVESASQEFNQLPPAVQTTVRAQAPDAEIVNVNQRTENGMTIYEIEFRDSDAHPNIVVGADGRLLSTTSTEGGPGAIRRMLTPTGAVGTQFSALPLDVQKAIQSRAPDAPITNISRHEEDGRVYYEVEFRDSVAHPPLRIAEDGTPLPTAR
jgi:hypothetical protein